MENLRGLVGIIVLLGIAVAFSSNRKKINLRTRWRSIGIASCGRRSGFVRSRRDAQRLIG